MSSATDADGIGTSTREPVMGAGGGGRQNERSNQGYGTAEKLF